MDSRLERLYKAAYAGDVNALNELLKEDELLLNRVITTTEVNDNPLHIAAFRGHASFARNIFEQNQKLGREFNAQGMSPLHLAAAEGHLLVAEELLQIDAELGNLQEDKNGYLPVHIAVIKGTHELVTLLIQKCEDFASLVTYSSETLLHLAIIAKRSEMVEHLTVRGVTKFVLNAKDANGNTSLHLAFAGRQRKIIQHLLSLPDIDVNSVNSMGLTPLDVLFVTNREMGDLYLGEILRASGGKTAKELGTSDTILIDSTSTDTQRTSPARVLSSPNTQVNRTTTLKLTEESTDRIDILMVVATLVAAATFTAALNPPGGYIQMSFDDKSRMDPTFFRNWKHMETLYPAGSPVYLWQLKNFFLYDCVALVLSVFVILLCLISRLARDKFWRKIMVLVLWLSILFMVQAFFSALAISFNTHQNSRQFEWFTWVERAWYILFGSASGAITALAISVAIQERPSWLPVWVRSLGEKIYMLQNVVQKSE